MILDTNALSALADGEAAVVAEVGRRNQIALPVIVVGEYRFGIAGSRQRNEYAQWLEEMMSAATVLDVDQGTAERYAAIRVELKQAGTPIPSNDLWIAALSRQHGLPVLSRDQHFERVKGLRRVGW